MLDSTQIIALIDKGQTEALMDTLKANTEAAKTFTWTEDFHTFTPLSYACERNKKAIIHAILDEGLFSLETGTGDHDMVDPVYTSAGHLNQPIVEHLLAAGFSARFAHQLFEGMGGELILKGKPLAIFKLLAAHC